MLVIFKNAIVVKKWLLTLGLLIGTFQVFAQRHENASDSLEVFFHNGRHVWAPEYMDNCIRLEGFVDRFRELREDKVMSKISKIHIVAGCSPEGSWSLNQVLSRNRAKCIREVLNGLIELPDSVVVEDAVGINWAALSAMVAADPKVPHQQEVLNIINNTPELYVSDHGVTKELRKDRLMKQFGGKAWDYMNIRFFPKLRSFYLKIDVSWELYEAAKKEVELEIRKAQRIDSVAAPATDATECQTAIDVENTVFKQYETVEIQTPPAKKPFYMALKTNLLYDALLVPNLGVEFYLGKHLSLAANWQYAWWKSDPSSWYHRTYGGDIELRYYFGAKAAEKPLQGWHAGVYGQILTYDFEWGNRGYLGDRWSYAGGLSVGYSLPVARRLNMDFTLGAGYLWGEYKEYLPFDDCYVWQATKRRQWIGPTKLEISLVWLLGRGNVNESKKGGAQ